MKKFIIIFFVMISIISAQCMMPIKSMVGLKIGLNYTIYNPDDGQGNLSGIGMHFGLAMGMDIVNTIGIQIVPSYRATSYSRTINNVTAIFKFNNFYIPVNLLFKAGSTPVVSPYLGIGGAGNFQLNGRWRIESNGFGIDGEIESEDLEDDLFLALILGLDIKLIKFNISPEMSFNYNLTADDPDTVNNTEKNYDLHFSIGFFYLF